MLISLLAYCASPTFTTASCKQSSSSIGTATLVGFGLLNYRWVFSAGRFLQSAVASGTSNSQPGGPVIRMFQLPPPGVPHAWNDTSEPQQRKAELWARNGREFCGNWRLPRHFWVLLHAVNLRYETNGFTSPPKEGALRLFSPEKSDGFGRVWTRKLGYQRPACLPLDHRSRSCKQYSHKNCNMFLIYLDTKFLISGYNGCLVTAKPTALEQNKIKYIKSWHSSQTII